MKLVANISFDNKVQDTLFYLPREFDARASSLDFGQPMIHMIEDVFMAYWWTLSYIHMMIGVTMLELKLFWWFLVAGSYFLE